MAVATSVFTLVSSAPASACSFIVAGPGATSDGSVLVGYNNDRSVDNWATLRSVAAGKGTHRYLKLRVHWAPTEGGMNDEQLAIPYRTATFIDRSVLAVDPFVKGGFGPEMWDRLLARCATASEAVDMLGQAMADQGCSSFSAGAIVLADPREAWIFEVLGGHHWAAARVPDDEVWFHPNAVGIREIDLSDPTRYRGSPDLEEFAARLGRYVPGQERFDVAWAYANRERVLAAGNRNRLWGALRLLAPSLQLAPAALWTELPGHFRPDHAVTPQGIAALLRSHYEDTPLDESAAYSAMTPHAMTTRPICHSGTDYTVVMQVRDGLPNDVGGVLWLSLSRPCASAFVPFYVSSPAPPAWRERTAFNAFRAVAVRLDQPSKQGHTLDYGRHIQLVRAAYRDLEDKMRAAQPGVEAAALALHGAPRAGLLAGFSSDSARAALRLSRQLRALMK
jgi:dipeptidase